MTRTALLTLVTLAMPGILAAAELGRPRLDIKSATIAPAPTVTQVLTRSWMGDRDALHEQLVWIELPVNSGFDAYVAERAAIRDCQAERYNASRSNLLDGGARPLRDC